jgi:hypothetical protein
VTVFGILNIIFGVFGLVGLVGSIALLFATDAVANDPVVKIMRANPTYNTWIKLSIPLGVLSCGALVASGVGLLLLKSWARKLSIGYAIYALVVGVVGMVMNYLFLMRPLLEEAQRKQGPEAAAAVGGGVVGTFGGCLGLIYPILLLIFMTRPHVVAAFRRAAARPMEGAEDFDDYS